MSGQEDWCAYCAHNVKASGDMPCRECAQPESGAPVHWVGAPDTPATTQEPSSTPQTVQVIPAQQGEVETRLHAHYFKDVRSLQTVDVYRVLRLFGVTDPCIQHALKKLLVAGGRGVKDQAKDVQEAIDTLTRWQEMRAEDAQGEKA